MGRYTVPSTIVGNTDPTAVRCLALANRAGRSIALDHTWQVLLTSHTFPTVNGTTNYALPSDFHRFANITQWDQTNDEQLRGPVSAAEWNYLQQSSVSVGSPFYSYFRIAGDRFYIYPTPTSARTIGYDYYSKHWITGKEEFTLDADVPLIDSDLLTLGLRWRLLEQLGDEWQNVYGEYQRRLEMLQAKDGGRDVIRFGVRKRDPYDNLPDSGFGPP